MNYVRSLVEVLSHPHNRKRKFQALIRIGWWKLNALTFQYPVVYPLTESIRCICYPGSSYAGLLVYVHRPEPEVSSFAERFLKSEDAFIDVGANIGVISLLAASRIRTGMIHAFEPDASVRVLLSENVALNHLQERVHVHSEAVSDTTGPAYFSQEKQSEISHLSIEKNKGIQLDAITLDDFLHREKIKHVRLLKVDVEGAEGHVLKGAQKALKNQKIDVVSLELNSRNVLFGTSHDQLVALLSSYGYKSYVLTEEQTVLRCSVFDQNTTHNILAVANKSVYKDVVKAWSN